MRNIDHVVIVKDQKPPEQAWAGFVYANLVLACGQELPNITHFENRHISSVVSDGVGHMHVGTHRVLWGGNDQSMAEALGKYAGNAKNTIVVGQYGTRVLAASKGASEAGRTMFVFDPKSDTAPDCLMIKFPKDTLEVVELNGAQWVPYNPDKEKKINNKVDFEAVATEAQQHEQPEKTPARKRTRRKQKKRSTK